MARRVRYPLAAVPVALGAPLGYLALRAALAGHWPTPAFLRAEVSSAPVLYAYLTLSTTVVLVILGLLLGRLEDRLIALATVDPLTGLFNRRYFEARLAEEVGRAARYQVPLSLAIFDVDHFKQVNDARGHLAGDALLRKVGRLLAQGCRAFDSLGARPGGDEFVALLPHTDRAGAALFAERLREQVRAELGVTLSAGVAELAQCDVSRATGPALAELADRALYSAKKAGRDRVAAYATG